MLVSFRVPPLADHSVHGDRLVLTGPQPLTSVLQGVGLHPGAPAELPFGTLLLCRDAHRGLDGPSTVTVHLVTDDGLELLWRHKVPAGSSYGSETAEALVRLLAQYPVPGGVRAAARDDARLERQAAASQWANRLLHVRYDDPEMQTRAVTSRVTRLPRVRYMREQEAHDLGQQFNVHVDEAAGQVWVAGVGGGPAMVLPLTAERQALIEELRACFHDDVAWACQGAGAEAAALLTGAGWDPGRLAQVQPLLVHSAADAEALLARTPQEWKGAGWDLHLPRMARWRAADAALLADAGVSCPWANALHEAGLRTVEEITTAEAPRIPADATRIVFPRNSFTDDPVVFTAPGAAQQWLDTAPRCWRDAIRAEQGPTVVHAAHGWSLWSDGEIVTGTWSHLWEMPIGLSAAAEWGIQLLVASGDLNTEDWSIRLREATTHRVDYEKEGGWQDDQHATTTTLTRHVWALSSGELPLWHVQATHSFYGGGNLIGLSVHGNESAARAAFEEACRRPEPPKGWALIDSCGDCRPEEDTRFGRDFPAGIRLRDEPCCAHTDGVLS